MIEIGRLSTPEDAQHCANLMASSEPWISMGRTVEESLALVNDPGREVYVARDDGAFRGFIILIVRGALVGYIQIIAVTQEARGTGVGTELIRFAEERIFTEFPNAFLCVTDTNVRARALYERLGYQLIGEIKDYLMSGRSEFLLRKTIAPIREFTARK